MTTTGKAVMIETIYLVHHSHMDIGFTDLADEVREQHLRHLDLALELCHRPKAHPDQPSFCWTIESAWIIEDYLRVRSAQQVERLCDALRRGQLELQAFYAQPLTELAVAEEAIQGVRFAAELGRRHGFAVECAMLNDIGGYMGRLPTILNGWGVRYLVAGVGGYQVHLPWADLPHLFYLQDKADGRILVWNLGLDRTTTPQQIDLLDAVYYMGGTFLMTHTPTHARHGGPVSAFRVLAERLRAEDYPYAEVLLQYAADNCGPDADLPARLLALSGHPDLPRIQLTTPSRFFHTMEERYGDRIPVLSGVITDPWVLRANPQPAPLAEHRAAQRRWLAAEARGVASPRLVEECVRALHQFTDHTCGLDAWNWQQRGETQSGSRSAAFDRFRQSWRDKARYADLALRQANALDRDARERILGDLVGTERAIVVWNDRPFPATGLAEVTLPSTQTAAGLRALGDMATRELVRFQRVAERKYLVEAADVPPFGYRVLQAEWERDPAPWPSATEPRLPSCPPTVESDRLRLTFEPLTGAIRQVEDKHTGETWLSGSASAGLGEFRYARVLKVSPTWDGSGMLGGIKHEWIDGKLERTWHIENGPLRFGLARERVFATPGPAVRVIEEVALPAGQPRIDFRYRIDKPETADKESGYIWFGVDLPGATFRGDQAVGWIEPRHDLLPGAMQDVFYVNQWANLSAATRAVTLVCPDAPVLQVGRLRTYEWRDDLPFSEDGSTLIAWPYHNLQQTDNPIWQDLLLTIQYSLFLHSGEGFDPVRCDRAAQSVLFPLRAQLATVKSSAPASQPWLTLASDRARWLSCRWLVEREAVCVRLEERTGREAEAVLRCGAKPVFAAKADTFFGERGALLEIENNCVRVPLKPFELATILLRWR